MRRPTVGLFARAAAMMAAAFLPSFNIHRPEPRRRWPLPVKKSEPKRLSVGRSKQLGSKDRLIVDRPSSIRKMQRWARAGYPLHEPDAKVLMRHGWYERYLRGKLASNIDMLSNKEVV